MLNGLYVFHSLILTLAECSITRVGFGWNFAFGPYGDSWRGNCFLRLCANAYSTSCSEHRKLAHIELQSKSASERYQPLELRGARFLLQTLMDDPDDFSDHIRLYGLNNL